MPAVKSSDTTGGKGALSHKSAVEGVHPYL